MGRCHVKYEDGQCENEGTVNMGDFMACERCSGDISESLALQEAEERVEIVNEWRD